MPATEKQSTIAEVIAAANQVILGKEPQIKMALACLLARGHLLIEDLPGVGKTTAVRRFSESHYASVITVNLREPRFHRISRRKPGA